MSTPEIKLKDVTQVKEYIMRVEGIGVFLLKRYFSGDLRVAEVYIEDSKGNLHREEPRLNQELQKLCDKVIEEFSKHI